MVNVDYYDNQTGEWNGTAFTDGVTSYRGNNRGTNNPATAVYCNISSETGAQYTMDRPGGIRMTANFKIGWVGSDNWWNYTRTIPAGVYRAFAAQSLGDTGEMRSHLYFVTAGVGSSRPHISE